MKFRFKLAKGANNAWKDSRLFGMWANKEISTYKAIREFKLNNHIPQDENIDEGEFESWLNSLGYFRGVKT